MGKLSELIDILFGDKKPKASKLKFENGRVVGDPSDLKSIQAADALNRSKDNFQKAARECAFDVNCSIERQLWKTYQRTGKYEDMTRWLKHRAYVRYTF